MNSATQKNLLYALVILVGLIIITFIMLPSSETKTANSSTNDIASGVDTETVITDTQTKINTIASAWQWEGEPLNRAQDTESLGADQHDKAKYQVRNQAFMPFTEESVFKALHAVNLDDNGDIILDDDALNALNSALDHSEFQLDAEGLEQLQGLIRKGLPGNAGEQTAQIVADFYQYLGAKNEFNSLYETNENADQSIESYETQYNELKALREVYLGTEASNKLFATSNANSRYMFESMKLEANASLSDDEKKQQQAEIIEQHEEATISVNNWNERYSVFLNDKHYIISSSLSDDQKRSQLADLMSQHFNDEELEAVSHLQLDSL